MFELTPRQKARERQNAGDKIRGAVSGRQHAVDDLERGQTPRSEMTKLLDMKGMK